MVLISVLLHDLHPRPKLCSASETRVARPMMSDLRRLLLFLRALTPVMKTPVERRPALWRSRANAAPRELNPG